MIEQELKNIWQNGSPSEHVKLDTSKFLTELKNKMEQIDRKIIRRDRREIIACIFGMVGFGLMTFYFPWPLAQLACALTVLWFAYVIYRLKNARRNAQPDASLSLQEQLTQRKSYLQTQSRLLHSAIYWYVIPPFLMNVLFFIGIGNPSEWDSIIANMLPESSGEKVVILALISLFYGYIAWMNRKAARENYAPLISDIEKLQNDLNKSE